MSGARFVRLTEVGPRDGLQNERTPVPTAAKIAFVDALSAAGFPEIEVSSFVSARWVPQLGDASAVFAGIARRPGTVYSALVPNERGMQEALAARVQKVAVFAAASESFSQRNTGGSIAQVLERFVPVVAAARREGLPVRGYISCVIACPYDGPTDAAQVRSVAQRLLELGVDEIDLGDTIGIATPESVERLYEGLAPLLAPGRTTLHLHDTNGRAVESARRALALGVRSFDASAGGLGGCPYAPGAQGNVSTGAMLAMLTAEGYETGVDAGAVARASAPMLQLLRA
ncbi:MAG: hydroxymethylglutaryl-CoA lyase [Phycisphaerales bacterium]